MMNIADKKRAIRVMAALDAAIAVFRRSSSKPAVGDIDAETELVSLRTELSGLIASDLDREREKMGTAVRR
jgi:hypothetical protein